MSSAIVLLPFSHFPIFFNPSHPRPHQDDVNLEVSPALDTGTHPSMLTGPVPAPQAWLPDPNPGTPLQH